MSSHRPISRKKYAGRSSSPASKGRPISDPQRSRRKPHGPKRQLHGDDEGAQLDQAGERLQKVLAAAGVASRRECEQLILEGRVEVDRKVVTELGTRVDPHKQDIRVDGEPLPHPKLVYFAINKPVGVVSTARDPAGRMRVTDLMPPNAPRVFCVGRLDITSEGLILVTNDGELANGLTHPRHGVEKIYNVEVAGKVEPGVLAQLHRGIHLAEGFAHAKHMRIKSRRKKSTLLEMVLDEGRNREVRRLLARVGHKVERLTRIAVGPVRLGDLPAGAVRSLTPKEVKGLQEVIARGRREEHVPAKNRPEPVRRKSPAPVSKKVRKRGKDGRTVIG